MDETKEKREREGGTGTGTGAGERGGGMWAPGGRGGPRDMVGKRGQELCQGTGNTKCIADGELTGRG